MSHNTAYKNSINTKYVKPMRSSWQNEYRFGELRSEICVCLHGRHVKIQEFLEIGPHSKRLLYLNMPSV